MTIQAVIFDLDGVITKTALVHAAAWKEMFDEYLKLREERDAEPFREFTHEYDYLPFVDGKPRYKGVESFLLSRNISIPFGDPNDTLDTESVCGLGNKKNVKFTEVLNKEGVEVYSSTVVLMKDLKEAGVHVGVASSSKSCEYVLRSTGLDVLVETRVDGVISAELGLNGKPAGDIFVRACENLDCDVKQSIVVEDAVSGVQAGVNGVFGLVIGVAREGNEKELKEGGADIVIEDFKGILTQKLEEWFKQKSKK